MTAPKLIFAGTGPFAVPVLRALAKRCWVVQVASQPDRPAGRGLEACPSAVSREAQALELPLAKPRSINAPEVLEDLREHQPNLMVVAGFGQLLKRSALDLPAKGCINVHGSLLPRWRGAAPVARAVMNGDEETGVTTIILDEGMDTGPILLQRRTSIGEEETAEEVEARLAAMGAELAVESIQGLLEGSLEPQPQPAEGTIAAKLTREEGKVDWAQDTWTIHNLVRGTQPWPGAWTKLNERRVKLLRSRPTDLPPADHAPGTVIPAKQSLLVATGNGVLELLLVQPEGCRPMPGQAFQAGYCRREPVRLGTCSS
ncbi:MAG: methionyl-tRNA formyltransferase [Candidatus Bipolaricaulota bacterium]